MMPILYAAETAKTWGDLAELTWGDVGEATWGALTDGGGARQFSDHGLGVLSDAASCVVTEERNGSFELEMEYPVEGLHYGEIETRSIIVAKPSPGRAAQPFRVYKITRPLSGLVTVYARHISYDLSGVAVAPFSASTLAEAIAALGSGAVPSDHGFTVTTNKGGTGGMQVTAPSSFRAILGGVEGSILDTYGGEWEFDGYSAKLWDARGEDRGVVIRYGKNLTSLEQETSCAEVYTAVYPYWTDGDTAVTLPEKTVAVTGTFGFTRILPVDLSGSFDEAPTADALRSAAEYYILDNRVGVPKVSLKVGFAQLEGETLELCDTVGVRFERLGVTASAKVVKTAYNVLLERYDTVEIGDARTSIADTIAGQAAALREMDPTLEIQKAVVNATGWITGAKGGNVIFKRNAEGQPTEILIMDTDDTATAVKVWRWNMGGLGFSANGVNGPYETAITQDGSILGKFVTADGLYVNAANITGKVTAGQIEADELHVKAANVDGEIVADAINLNTANVSGTLTAEHLDLQNADISQAYIGNLTVGASNIPQLYANSIVGGAGATGGYVASKVISDTSHPLSDLNVTDVTANEIHCGTTMRLGGGSSYVVIGGTKVSYYGSTTMEATWADILSGSAGGAVAVFG